MAQKKKILKNRVQNNTEQNLTSNSKPNFRAHLISSILRLPTIPPPPHFVLLFVCLFPSLSPQQEKCEED